MRWNVGRVKITRIVELETVGSTRFILPLATPEQIQKLPWLVPDFATEEGRLKMSIHSLVIETPSRRIVVDTGLGNDKEGRKVPTWNSRKGPFLETMTAAGFPPDSIDTVICTHLHVDHVGWNTRLVGGKWVSTFANARYVFGKTEYEHWRDHSNEPDKSAVFNDSVKPIVDAGKADLVASDARLCDEITPDIDARPQPRPCQPSHQIRWRRRPAHRRRRPSPLPDGASRVVFDRRFRSGPVGGDAARVVLAFCRHADARDRRPFQRRLHPA
jgi:Metallo-beta-lactamase superfamily